MDGALTLRLSFHEFRQKYTKKYVKPGFAQRGRCLGYGRETGPSRSQTEGAPSDLGRAEYGVLRVPAGKPADTARKTLGPFLAEMEILERSTGWSKQLALFLMHT
jgi:hypothetical protein